MTLAGRVPPGDRRGSIRQLFCRIPGMGERMDRWTGKDLSGRDAPDSGMHRDLYRPVSFPGTGDPDLPQSC